MKPRNVELLIWMSTIVMVTQVPLFMLAAKVSGDEFAKASLGIIGGGAVAAFTAYRMWRSGADAYWYWWRHNHNMAFWPAVWWTFRASILRPLNNFRCGIINRTYGRWKMNRLRKMWKKEFGEDIFD